MDAKIKKEVAETYHINHPTASYGIFCFNTNGDLFLNSDWGFYCYAWRSYGGTFKEFLSSCDVDYLSNKFAIIHNNDRPYKDRLQGVRLENVKLLLTAFVTELKNERLAKLNVNNPETVKS